MNIKKTKSIISKVLWGLLIAALAFFFGKTAIFEYNYYNEKEGSPRAVSETSGEEEALDETEVSADERAAYNVAPDRPRYLSIEKLGVKDARVFAMGLKSSGELNTPAGIYDVGWYSSSGKPGEGRTVLIDGHNGGPTKVGVFKYLPELEEGDLITLERGDGEIFEYKVVENKEISLNDSDSYMSIALTSPERGKESLTLITCTGEWSQTKQTYLSRQFVRAVLVD
ncbi:class F sortase [Candidatus Saccharibacteria bacterium]|nr:class F sortase [Candidatus Saccharibacteria bacterium]